MEEFIALRDCVITGHAGIVREGDRVTLSPRAARYPRLKGWIEPAPAQATETADPPPEPTPEAPTQAPRRRRTRKT